MLDILERAKQGIVPEGLPWYVLLSIYDALKASSHAHPYLLPSFQRHPSSRHRLLSASPTRKILHSLSIHGSRLLCSSFHTHACFTIQACQERSDGNARESWMGDSTEFELFERVCDDLLG